MHDAIRPVGLAMAALTLAACGATDTDDQAADNAATADIDVLPADESVATSSDELASGVNDPDVNALGNQH